MSKLTSMIILSVFFFVFGIGTPASAVAASLEQYLGSTLGQLASFRCDVASPEIMPASNESSGAAAGNRGATMGKLHKYMGYGTLIAAVTAGVSGGDNAFHKGAGDATAALAVATCVTGFSEYSQYFDMDEGLSPYNIHIVLATLATVGFVATAIDANSNKGTGHAGLGIGSTALMAVPIIVLHF